MDGLRARAKVSRGYGIAAAKLGTLHEHYRPADPLDPLGSASEQGEVRAAFDPGGFSFRAPKRDDKPTWSALVDSRVVAPGDYVRDSAETWFIADIVHLLPATAVRCNAVISVRRPTASNAVGVVEGYQGNVVASEETILAGWPCALTLDGSGDRNEVRLPSDGRLGSFAAWLPVSLPMLPQSGDFLVAEDGRRIQVNAVMRQDGIIRVRGVQLTV